MPQSKKIERIIKLLGGDEPDYSIINTKLSEKDIPILNELVMHQSTGIAARAIICLTWFASDKSLPGIESAAKSDNPILRLSAARALGSLGNKPGAFDLISGLLDDKDTGVRKFVLKAIGTSKMPTLKEKVRQVSLNDPNEQIRKLAQQVYEKLETPNNLSAP
jgi:HEAT repeat protein